GAVWRPDRCVVAELQAEEAGLGDADDLEWLAVDRKRASDDVRPAAVFGLPEGMRDHGNGAAILPVVSGPEGSPGGGPNSQCREETAGDEAHGNRASLPA